VVLPTITFTFDADDVTKSETLAIGQAKIGLLSKLEVIIANCTNAITAVITITSPRGGVIYTSAGLAENATTVVSPAVHIEAGSIITATLSGITGDAGDKTIVLSGYISELW